MEIILRLEEFTLKDPNENWLENTLDSIFNVLGKSKWGNRLKYFYRFQDDKIRNLKSFDQLKNIINKYKNDTYVLQESNSEKNSIGVYLEIHEFGFSIILFENFNENDLIQSIVQSMIDFTREIYLHISNMFLLGYRLGIELYELKNYVVEQERINDYWECNKIVDFLSFNFHKTSETGRLRDYGIFSEFNFPQMVSKTKKGDLLTINWNNKTNNTKEISNSMKYRDEWIYSNLS